MKGIIKLVGLLKLVNKVEESMNSHQKIKEQSQIGFMVTTK